MYVENTGRPGKPIRLMVALHYINHTFDKSDESVVERFLENPYGQYFAGYEHMLHHLPLSQPVAWPGRSPTLVPSSPWCGQPTIYGRNGDDLPEIRENGA